MSLLYKYPNVITLFHKAGSPASLRVYTILKQASATASEHATEDQASDHSHQTHPHRREFELNVTEDPPTPEQLKDILQYIGAHSTSNIICGAKKEADAIRKLEQNSDNFQSLVVCWPSLHAAATQNPVADQLQTVDWNNRRAVAGDNKSQILRMVESLPKG